MTKEVNDEAYNKEGENRGDYLREVIARYRELEKEHQATVQKVKLLESCNKHSNTEPNKQKDLQGDLRAVIQQYRKLEKYYLDLLEWKKE
jgi:predicted metal-binding protein